MAREYDYRGGAAHIDPFTAAAISKIEAGQAPGQVKRAFRNKAILTGVVAGVGALGNVAKGEESKQLQRKQAEDAQFEKDKAGWIGTSAHGVKSASAPVDQVASGHSRSFAGAMDRAVMNGSRTGGSDHSGQMDYAVALGQNSAPLDAQAKLAQSRMAANDAAGSVAVGGYRTPEGLQAAHDESDMLARDLNMGMDHMKLGAQMPQDPTAGGMMSSLRRRMP